MGCNMGFKLSATENNSEQLRSLQSVESQRVRLDRSGWGPGGRRFKSCLRDQSNGLIYGPRLPELARHLDGEQTENEPDGSQCRRGVQLGAGVWSTRIEGVTVSALQPDRSEGSGVSDTGYRGWRTSTISSISPRG